MTQVANLNTKMSLESASFVSGIEKSRGALRSLIASLDPAAAAQARFNRESQLLDGALKRGLLSAEAYNKGLEVLRSRLSAATVSGGEIVKSAGSQRAGFQQLSFQIGDIATQYGSGTKAMTIFAQQSGQVIQALGLMTNSTKGLLGFLGGPWGQIITAATIVLVPLISKLFESADAGKAAADGVLTYVDALKQLQDQGGAFKFGSREFGEVSKKALEAQASVNRLQKELAKAPKDGPGFMTPGGTGPMRTERTQGAVQADLKRALFERDRTQTDLKALLIQQNNRADAERPAPMKGAKGASARASRPKADRSDQRLERYDDQLAQLQQQQLGLLEAITPDIRKQADLQHQRVDAALEAYRIDLDHQVAQKEITAGKAQELLTVRQRNAELEHTKINWALDDKLTQQELDLTKSRLENVNELNRGELDAARTQADRRRIQLDILENERQLEAAALEAVKAKHDSTDVEYQIAQAKLDQLGKESNQRAGAIRRDTMGPMASYLDSLPRTADELKERFEGIRVDALNNGLELASQNVLKLKGVAGQLFNQLIADVIRLNLQAALTGGGSGLLGSLGKLLGLGSAIAAVPGSAGGMNLSGYDGRIQGMASGGSMRIGGVPGVDRNVLSINGIPRAMVSHNENFSVGYGQQSNAARIEIVEHPGFASRVVGISGDVSIKTTRASNNAAFRRGRARLA